MLHSEVIGTWPSLSEFAADIGVEYGTAKAMRRRSSIPPQHWVAVVKAAEARGYIAVTYEAMAVGAAAPAAVAS